MVIYVCVKQVPDTETKIKIKPDKSGIDTSAVKWIMNPYDEYAVEEALQKKEALNADKIVVITYGPTRASDALRTALAMGADEGLHILSDEELDANSTAKAIATAIKKEEEPGYVFTGKLAIDGNNACIGQQIARCLEIPHASVVSKLEVDGENIVVERETEAGTKEIIQLNGPALIAANKGLNTPRFVSLPGIMKAKKKPVKQIQLSDLDIASDENKVTYKDFELPKEKPEVKMLEGESAVKDLVNLLRTESKVV